MFYDEETIDEWKNNTDIDIPDIPAFNLTKTDIDNSPIQFSMLMEAITNVK